MYKINCILLLLIISLLSYNVASPTHKPSKQLEQQSSSSSSTNQNTNSFRPINGDNHGGEKKTNKENVDENGKPQGEGFAKGQVFEYSYSTFHQDPQSADILSPMSDDKQETILTTNGSDNFADHEVARQTLPRFFSYPSTGGLNDNSTDPSASIKQFEEAFKVESTGTSENPIVANFQPALGEVAAAASYFSYAPPSVPSFMKMGFSESDIDDGDMDDESLDGSDLDFKSSNSPKKLERSSEYKDKDGENGGEEDPKVKMVQVLMGRKNEKGKPWGTKTTLVYRDPKDANNYMQVTEVKMSVKSKKDGPESSGDEMSKESKSSFHGSSYASQPTLGGYGGDFFEPNEPPEPTF
ncbi:uncharacterized protein LOC128395795 [Panonychus citri]|uniref:uncharacterized protein LOC128395795 n=1 Tax=Panonychus citri TaxID=50023 RepID=UPI0023073FBC|nr:uncharacterized protein LOC128395795 [Panonychus citri]